MSTLISTPERKEDARRQFGKLFVNILQSPNKAFNSGMRRDSHPVVVGPVVVDAFPHVLTVNMKVACTICECSFSKTLPIIEAQLGVEEHPEKGLRGSLTTTIGNEQKTHQFAIGETKDREGNAVFHSQEFDRLLADIATLIECACENKLAQEVVVPKKIVDKKHPIVKSALSFKMVDI